MAAISLAEVFGGAMEAPTMGDGLNALCLDYLKLRESFADLDQQAKDAKNQMEAAQQVIIERMAEAGWKSVRLPSGELFTECEKHRYSLPPKGEPEKREAALKWIARIGGKELIQRDINWNTLNAFIKERIEEGKALNAEFISDYTERYLSVRKG